ncbi:microfibril-associated glycoprotein 4-like [Crassostrea angulata]|uniref:microfibril-associated glycoprotein 4-like n=1 Tax=Magallana angulata TaxID=2784310 RepID=UPI0022B1F3AF|nr:microfibril-associated glycoprotein 4-like [Crassostrea angulata]
MVSFRNMFFTFGLVDYFVTGIAVEPHSKLKGNVESLLELTPWTWKHMNTSFKVDSPVTLDQQLTNGSQISFKHLKKMHCLRLQKQRDCASILKTISNTKGRDGLYTIYPDMKTKKLVYCDMTTDGGGWTVIQRRMDGSVNFYRSWQTYKDGFGKLQGEYWLGNEDIHLLTAKTKQELRVDLQKFSGEKAYAKYSRFTMGSESEKYKLSVGGYSGTAGDSLAYHNGMKFSTRDQDNDLWNKHCSVEHQGGWWFNACIHAILNGPYLKSAKITAVGMTWYTFGNEHRALKRASMMIRPKI